MYKIIKETLNRNNERSKHKYEMKYGLINIINVALIIDKLK